MPINQFLVGCSLTLLANVGGVSPCFTAFAPPSWIAIVGENDAVHLSEQRASAENPEPSDWKPQFLANVRGLSELHAGWDGPGSVPVPETLLVLAAFYVESALSSFPAMMAPRLVPGGDGSVQIEWHTKRGELEFDIDDHSIAYIWVRDHLNGVEFEGEGEDAVALFYRWAPWVAARHHDVVDVTDQEQMATFAIAA